MLGILVMFYVGKSFFDLAHRFNKEVWLQWVLGFMGIGMYYLGTFIGGILLGVAEAYGWIYVSNMSDIAIAFLGLPFGLLACIIFYYLLKRYYSKTKTQIDPNILDDI